MFDQNSANAAPNMNNANNGMGNIPNAGMQGVPMGVSAQDPMAVDPNAVQQNPNAVPQNMNTAMNGAGIVQNNANTSWQQPRLEIDGLEDVREGVYANIALARTSPKESILDFVFVDSNEPDGQGNVVTRGRFQARIVMSNASLIELRDMLDKHIAQHAPIFPLGNIAN